MCGDNESVYARADESLVPVSGVPGGVHISAFSKEVFPGSSLSKQVSKSDFFKMKYSTTKQTKHTLVYIVSPLLSFLEAEGSLRTSVIRILVDMNNLLVRPGESPGGKQSAEQHTRSRQRQEVTNSARSDWLRPVPEMTTSHGVSANDSIPVD